MKKNVMMAIIVLVIVIASLMYFFQSRDKLEQNGENLPDDVSTTSAESKSSNELYDVKSAIGNVIDDSVQEDIQKAVGEEVLKTTEPKK